jgi:hypothetical protein
MDRRKEKKGMARVEIQRTGVTETRFRAACRAALRKAGNGLEAWVDEVNDAGKQEGKLNGCGTFSEFVREHVGEYHSYYKGADGHGWNFIFEFTPDTGEGKAATGHGYFSCSEF